MKNFEGKVAVITGAGSGMGRELAIELAKSGANIALAEWNEDTLNETAELLKNYNVGVSKHVIDVSDKEAVFALPQKVIDEHGAVDMVFNNAGVALSQTIEDSTDEDWDWGAPAGHADVYHGGGVRAVIEEEVLLSLIHI